MKGPYHANDDNTISYVGNKVFKPIKNVADADYLHDEVHLRAKQMKENVMWRHIARINHQINISSNEFFHKMGALFTALPLTTRMISSPGAVYGKEAINYTTDTSPIKIRWFDLPDEAFLSESSQIYLEIALMQKGINHVYSIYNSFRKEEADATHLSEFHHIEYEGNVNQEENERLAMRLTAKIISDLLENCLEDLEFFLEDSDINDLRDLVKNIEKIQKITFQEALEKLHEATGNEKYKKFTLQNFGPWEEVKLAELYGTIVAVTEFPLLEVPFYHAMKDESDPKVADNTDFIWPGYREFIGSGHRVRSEQELAEKAKIFCLPKEDYKPYMQTRELPGYVTSSGFGVGWERFLQGLLKLPFIWTACQFPRGHKTLKP